MNKGLKKTRRRKEAKVKVLRRRTAIRKAAKAEREHRRQLNTDLPRDEQIRMAKLNLLKLENLQAEHDDYKKMREERSKQEVATAIDAMCAQPTEEVK